MRHTAHLVDANLLAIHKLIASKIQARPELITQVETKLEERFKVGLIYRGNYLNWSAIIDLQNDMPALVAQLCEDSDEMNRLRRQSPFVGVLSEQEREDFLANNNAQAAKTL
ncbi:hypothetical protein [Aliiglaciecola sp. LCG003]|uniref:hypothetical protein n=1 Tax=Aliiglaciecola sp. LCG003 TaxID=3053655 RepID=UPI00257379D2|nr:hypothetical protein [Aliiglaciecola sp. LCG003]WJG10819.1 hypothetical protein QR722_07210 [Aliiglaciecola sp. LCG003]